MITIAWIVTATVADPLGGDTVSSQDLAIVLDGTARETYETSALATEHPVEDGADVTDHVKPELRRLTLDVVVSAHPGPTSPAWVDLTDSDDPSTRPRTIRQTIDKLIAEGQEVIIETDVRSYDSMLLLSAQEERAGEGGGSDGYKATIIAREIRRVSTSEVAAPSPRVERGRRPGDRGRQRGDTAEVAPVSSQPELRSIAATLVRTGSAIAGGRPAASGGSQ